MTIIRQYYRQARVSRANDAEWTAENPVLKSGEVGFETNTRMVKVGNGIDAWNSLSYITALAAGGSIAVEDDTVSVDVAANTLDFGTGLDVTDDGGGHLTIDSTGSGATDHGALTGLADDDHPQYLTEAEGDAAYADITEPIAVAHRDDTTNVHDHGQLAGLADDDHPQYETSAEVDTKVATHAGAADPHTGYLKESVLSEANVTDLTDGGETALHSHAGSGSTIDVQEEGVLELAASALNFDGDDFDIVDAGGGVAAIDVAATHAGSTHSAATDTHIADTADAHDASAISADSTTLVGVGTDVQAVLEELDNGIADHLADAADAHDASSISIVDAGNDFTATDVEGALDELQADNEAHAAAADPHAGYRLESADHAHTSTGAQAGQLDHGTALTGLGDDDHPQYALDTDLTTHAGAADPHTGYRLESADHSHASTGLQAGTIDHGAITGLTDDDHTQYLKESDVDAVIFTVGGTILSPSGAVTVIAWRAEFACTVTQVRGQVDTGTTTVINAGKGFVGGTTEFCSADITIDPADAWETGTVNQNQSISAGDTIYLELITVGTATQVTIQVTLTRDLSP